MFLMFQNLLAVWNVLANHNQCWNITVIFKNDRTHHKVTCVRYIWSPSGLFFKCSGPQVQVWSCSIMNPTAPWNWLKDDGFLLGSKRLFCLQGSFFAVRFSFFFDVGRWELWMNFSFRISCFFYAVTLRGPWLFVTKVMKHPDPQTNGAHLKRVYPRSGNEGMSPGTWDYISSWIIFQGF